MPLSPRMPELAALEVLLAVAHRGSINAAASEVGVSQQAVSSRLRGMEAQIGVPLLHRGARGTTLSPAGEAVVQWASRVLQAASDMDAGLNALRQDRQASLRISASLTVAEHLLPGWLVTLRQRQQASVHPVTDVALTATNSTAVLQDIESGGADLGFVEGPDVPAQWGSVTVARDVLTVVAPPNHPWSVRHRPITARQVATTPLVCREAGSGTRTALEKALHEALANSSTDPAPAPPVLALGSAAAVRAAVLAGAGPAVMSSLAIADDLAAGRLVAVTVTGIDLRRELRAVWPGPRQPPAGPVRDLLAIAAGAPAQGRRRGGAVSG